MFHQECLYLMIDVRLVDEMGTPMSTPTSSDADDSCNEVSIKSAIRIIRLVRDIIDLTF